MSYILIYPGGIDVCGRRISGLLAQVDNVGVIRDEVSVPVSGHYLLRAGHAYTFLRLNFQGDEVLDLLVLLLQLLKGVGHDVKVVQQVIRGFVHVHVFRDCVTALMFVFYF